jgi:peptidoglycan/xylan/chitin deacetylase (PgdA/CDA1 family)
MTVASNPIVLTYHSISSGRSPLRISPSLFAEQLDWLNANARVVPLERIVAALAAREPLPERAVVLTFDDGFQDFFSDAAPLLRRYNFPATVFLPVQFCGKTNAWPGQPSWVAEQPLLRWEQIRELAQQGIGFGSHGMSHRAFTELQPEELESELVSSKHAITEKTGQTTRLLCYPYGRWNEAVRAAAARHFECACATSAGLIRSDSDLFALPRVDAHYVRSPVCFRRMLAPGFPAYVAGRRWIRRLQGQPEGYLAKPTGSPVKPKPADT